MHKYLLVTPAKNEEEFLPNVIKSVTTSSSTPQLWVIVDDNSTDDTSGIVGKASKIHDYIKILSLDVKRKRDMTFHYSFVCKQGFDYAIQLAENNKFDWDYMILLDADTVVDPLYFEGIINEMEADKKIGIASGDISILKNNVITKVKVLRDIPSGTARIWNRRCFEETGGYCITQSPDSVSRVKSILKGWKTVRFEGYSAYQLRDTSSAEGLWKGSMVSGKAGYYVNKHPLIIFLYAVNATIKKPHYTGVAVLYGYFMSLLKRESQIDDDEIKDYYWNIRLKVIIRKLSPF